MNSDKDALRPSFKFMSIHELPEGFETELKDRVNTTNVFIIVHPSYYLFFGKNNPLPVIDPGRNVVATFINTDMVDQRPFIDLMKLYERTEVEFFSNTSDEPRLIILVMPGRYLSSKIYMYRGGDDEYARYLNEVISDKDAVFYVESIRSSTGKMSKRSRRALKKFLWKIKARNIYIGGGYVGRCQKEVYKIVSKMWPDDRIAIIPDISSFSPRDVSDSTAKMLLTNDTKLNTWSASYYIKNGILKNFEVNLKNFPIITSPEHEKQLDLDLVMPENDNDDNIDLSPEKDDPGIEDFSSFQNVSDEQYNDQQKDTNH